MPKLKRPIRESDQSVVRPVAIGVIQDVLFDRMGLPSNTPINYPGYAEAVAIPTGNISNKIEQARMPTNQRVFIDVTEKLIPHLANGNVVDTPEHIPLFLNRDLELELRPIYASMEMTIDIRYRAPNKTEARAWYDNMMTKIPIKEDTWLHDIKYSFGLPEVYVPILEEIHRLTELQEGYGDTFEQFLEKWINPRYGFLTDQAGKNKIGVFSDTQERCLGFFDMDVEPDWGGRKDETDVWEVTIPYVLRYEKPRDVWMSYPIVIHNSVLSSRFRGTAGFERLQDRAESRTWSMAHLKSFEAMESVKRPYNDHPGRYFPAYDEFMPRMVPPNSMRVVTALCLLGDEAPGEPNLLMNLKDLEEEQFSFFLSDCLKDYIAEEAENVTIPRGAALTISLYRNRQLMSPELLRVDKDLNVYTTTPLSKRAYYHIRVAVVTDFTYLTPATRKRLLRKPCVINSILEYVLPEGTVLPPMKYVPGTDPNKPNPSPRPPKPPVCDERWFETLIENLKGRSGMRMMRTVQFTTINGLFKSRM